MTDERREGWQDNEPRDAIADLFSHIGHPVLGGWPASSFTIPADVNVGILRRALEAYRSLDSLARADSIRVYDNPDNPGTYAAQCKYIGYQGRRGFVMGYGGSPGSALSQAAHRLASSPNPPEVVQDEG